jgi:Ca-activated chloride channel family protein
MDDGGRKLEEVARAAGVSPRTVRYYIQRGLLPPPRFRGPDTAYGDEHVVRLRAIRRLQEAFWPLDAIAGLFASKTDRELEAIADGTSVPAPSASLVERDEAHVPKVAPRVGVRRTVDRGRLVRRIPLTDELVLEISEPASDEAESLLDAVRTLVAKHRR